MMMREYRDRRLSEASLPNENISDSGSDVEYPLINLKNGLTNDLKEKRMKDIERFSNKNQNVSKYKNTEFSREVLGHNKMVQFQMSKAVNYFFSEFDYLREKIKRTQQKTIEQLNEIHLDKRRQIRESYKYHNEETRHIMQRAKEEEKFLAEQAELEEMMRRREKSILRLSMEKKNIMKEINFKEKPKKIKAIKKRVEEIKTDDHLDFTKDPVNELLKSKSRSFLHAGALEVTKNKNNPKTVKRSMDYIETYERPVSNVSSEKMENPEENLIDKSMKEEEMANQVPNILIVENEILQEKDEKVETKKKMTAKDIMKHRKQLRAEKLKEILNLPYNIYRRNSKGKLQKIDHPVSKSEFKEPSNRDRYKMRKVLSNEKEKYQNYIVELAKTTEMILQEDIKITRQLNAPQIKINKDTITLPQRAIGPKDWMKAYVSSNIPDDVDPSSTEAIIYCRYIRAPLHKYSHLPNYKLYHTPL